MEVTKHRYTLSPQSWSLKDLRDFLKRTLQTNSIDQQSFRQIVLAVDEVAANIVDHAYPEGTNKANLDLEIDVQEDRVVIQIRDSGIPFNPLRAKEVDPGRSFSARLRRGYGIALIRRIIDDMQYERTEGGENVLTMTKRIQRRDAE